LEIVLILVYVFFLQNQIFECQNVGLWDPSSPTSVLCVLKLTHYVLWNDQALPIMLGNVLLVSPLGRSFKSVYDPHRKIMPYNVVKKMI
jgi:hypothetical protein